MAECESLDSKGETELEDIKLTVNNTQMVKSEDWNQLFEDLRGSPALERWTQEKAEKFGRKWRWASQDIQCFRQEQMVSCDRHDLGRRAQLATRKTSVMWGVGRVDQAKAEL